MLESITLPGLDRADFDPIDFTPAQAEEIAAGIAEGRALSKAAGFSGRRMGNWICPAANTGNFFQAYLGCAGIAVSDFPALPVARQRVVSGPAASLSAWSRDYRPDIHASRG
ncbi:hypothetical protein [Novosphingobium terrae]|uniref:hypothetical protein n=1 Tax=Novosphingobium terrae TaxID=2726189 RepID=UPI00198025C1|nr:hypothetical protein [Novosphingobium terrae]